VFDNIPAGDYVVRFATLPAGYEFTRQGTGGGADSNPDSSGVTPVFTVSPTSGDVRPVFAGDGVVIASIINPTIDAGIWNPSTDVASQPPVPPTPPPPPGGLPATGAQDVQLLLVVGLLAMFGGLGLLVMGRRRSV
jgi:LPXTG-motif cell wall-anchored protein